MTSHEAVRTAAAALERAGLEAPRLNAELIVAHALHCQRLRLTVEREGIVTAEQLTTIQRLTADRATGRPLPYVLGEIEFCGLRLRVDERALVPRPETELLVEQVLNRLTRFPAPTVAEVGTGTGAIALSIAHTRPDGRVVSVDVSTAALSLAQANAAALRLTNVEFRVGDLCAPLSGERFEVLCANLPYVPTEVIDSLQVEVRAHEPRVALDGGADGLDLYRRFAREARGVLAADGFVACEMGVGQAETMRALFADWRAVTLVRDLAGIERVLLATCPSP